MQGRLSPPIDNRIQAFPAATWRDEFDRCAELGLTSIEWIYEVPALEANPLHEAATVPAIRQAVAETGVGVGSVVADYFMERFLFGDDADAVDAVWHVLDGLLERCSEAEIPVVELPFVDASSLSGEAAVTQVSARIGARLDRAQALGLAISLETDLPPDRFRDLVAGFGHPALKINYDMGNSAALGFEAASEIALIGPWIANVHIKDRVRGGGTVPLGTGDTDFAAVFAALHDAGYAGEYILQAARQDIDGANAPIMDTIAGYMAFAAPYLDGQGAAA